VGGASIT